MLLHYLGKLKISNFALFLHVKHVSDVIFLSSIQQISVKCHKISAKINNVQNINILLFVCSLSLTSLYLWSYARQAYRPSSVNTVKIWHDGQKPHKTKKTWKIANFFKFVHKKSVQNVQHLHGYMPEDAFFTVNCSVDNVRSEIGP